MDVGRLLFPIVGFGVGGGEAVPAVGALGDFRVDFLEHLRCQVFLDNFVDLSSGRPYVLEEHFFAFVVLGDRFSLKIDIDSSSECVGHNQRRRRKVVSFDIRMYSGLEVSIA